MTLRQTIIACLNDENGINSLAHAGLMEICEKNGWHDIVDKVDFVLGRAFLKSEDAIALNKMHE